MGHDEERRAEAPGVRFILLALVAIAIAPVGFAAGPEEELGPEKMALADEIVEKLIYGIRYENLPRSKFASVAKAWATYYGEQGLITKRESMIMQVYATRAATLYQQGVPHVPYAERMGQGRAAEGER